MGRSENTFSNNDKQREFSHSSDSSILLTISLADKVVVNE